MGPLLHIIPVQMSFSLRKMPEGEGRRSNLDIHGITWRWKELLNSLQSNEKDGGLETNPNPDFCNLSS